MLTPGIARAYAAGCERLAGHRAVRTLARGAAAPGRAQAALFRVRAADLLADASLADEVFGPCSVLVECADMAELQRVLAGWRASSPRPCTWTRPTTPTRAGCCRCWSARPAGCWPTAFRPASRCATPWSTAVLSRPPPTGAAPRWARPPSSVSLRPVCYQNLPEALLPERCATAIRSGCAVVWPAARRAAPAEGCPRRAVGEGAWPRVFARSGTLSVS